MEKVFVREILLILFFALAGGYIALKLKQPALIGYLIGGLFLSVPLFSKYIDFDVSRNVAQIGIALLLFTTGLEFSITKLLSIKFTVIISVFVQAFLFIIFSTFIFSKLYFSNYQGLFLAAAFSNSATIVVLHIIDKSEDIDINITNNIIQWMILQDIVMVIVAAVVNTISQSGIIEIYGIVESLAKSFAFICAAILLGKSVIPFVFESVSKLKSFEILLILSFVFCMLIAYLAELIGLSYTLGAFLAGIMISESFVNHEIISEIKPLRDIFSVLFYVTLGTLLSFEFFIGNIFKISVVLIVLLILKFITTFIVILIFKKQTRTAFLLSLILNQGGEFTFILSQIGLENNWIDKEFYSINIIVSILSILLSPILIPRANDWYYKIRKYIRDKSPKLYRFIFVKLDSIVDIDQPEITNHVVICGFGRVGTYVGRALERTNIPYIVIDSDTDTVDYCKQRGIKIVFGDASNIDVLEKADIERAVALVIALPEEAACEIIASNSRALNPKIKVVARSHVPEEDRRLKVKGVTVTVEPEFEAAVSISKKILNYFGKKELDVTNYLKKSRRRKRSKIGNNKNE